MFVSRDKSGTILLSENKPSRQLSHWSTSDKCYMVMNKDYGDKLFPDLKWNDEPIEISIILNKHIL